jgi:soluble lytic murein transglycosylase
MQITPATAQDIARKSGGVLFETADLGRRRSTSPTARITCATCSTASAATRRSRWPPTTAGRATWTAGCRRPPGAGEPFRVADIPFPETREYVGRVRDAAREYRANYARELGL